MKTLSFYDNRWSSILHTHLQPFRLWNISNGVIEDSKLKGSWTDERVLVYGRIDILWLVTNASVKSSRNFRNLFVEKYKVT